MHERHPKSPVAGAIQWHESAPLHTNERGEGSRLGRLIDGERSCYRRPTWQFSEDKQPKM